MKNPWLLSVGVKSIPILHGRGALVAFPLTRKQEVRRQSAFSRFMDNPAGPGPSATGRVQDGDFVILQYGEGRYEKHRKILQVRSLETSSSDASGTERRAVNETLLRVGSRYVHPSALIDLPWGVRLTNANASETLTEATTEREQHLLLAVRADSETINVANEGSDLCPATGDQNKTWNTSEVGDDRLNQTLSDAELAAYKRLFRNQPQRYIAQLAEASKTFHRRSNGAQSKYLERKRNRHVFSMRLIRPTICTLTETLHHKMEGKSLWMHPEALAFVLQQAAIWSGTKRVLILEELADRMGLVTAACANRMCFPGRLPHREEGILLFTTGSLASSAVGPAMAMLGVRPNHKRRKTQWTSDRPLFQLPTENAITNGHDDLVFDKATGSPTVRVVPLTQLRDVYLKRERNAGDSPLQDDNASQESSTTSRRRDDTRTQVPNRPALGEGSLHPDQIAGNSRQSLESDIVPSHLPLSLLTRQVASTGESQQQRSQDIIRSWLDNTDQGNEALIIAFKDSIPGYDELAALLGLLLPLLTPGYPFVVWSPWIQPLAEVHARMTAPKVRQARHSKIDDTPVETDTACALSRSRGATGKGTAADDQAASFSVSNAHETETLPNHRPDDEGRITEGIASFLRQVAHVRLTEIITHGYQFLEERTHPWMSSTPPSGFILSGFRVHP
jgi:hypothetical protein